MPPENPSSTSSRKLAAILFADVVGYTALMQKDEDAASTLLRRFQKELEKNVKQHNGKVVNFYGDGALCTFENPLEAMQCAIAVQSDFQVTPNVPVRVGIHSGTVVYEGDKVFGDSVNVASRIESMGIPGAILVSKKVRDELKNQPDLLMPSLGTFEFKNVEEPMEVFALANEGFSVPHPSEMLGKLKQKTDDSIFKNPILKWVVPLAILVIAVGWFYGQRPSASRANSALGSSDKSIAIIPFRDLSPNQDQEYFADGIVEAIRAKLAQVEELKVTSMTSVLGYRGSNKSIGTIANELNVNHILEGTVFRDANRVRIIAQLIETSSDNHLWAGTFDEELNDIFDIQSRIANEVSDGLEATLTPVEKIKLALQVSSNVDAYDIFLTARNEWSEYQKTRDLDHFETAYEKYQEAYSIDSKMDKALSGMSFYWLRKYRMGEENALDSAMHFANKAIELNPYNEEAFVVKGRVHWYRNELKDCKTNLEKALEISPNYTFALSSLATYYGMVEKNIEEQINLSLQALSLDPKNNNSPDDQVGQEIMLDLADLYDNADMDKEAFELRQKALQLYPNSPTSYNNMAWHYMSREMYDKAISHRLRFIELLGVENVTHDYLDNLAFTHFLAGKYQEAEKYYNLLQEKIDSGFVENPSSHVFRHRLAVILNESGREEEARIMFDKHIIKCLDDIEQQGLLNNQAFDLAGVYAYLGEQEKAYQWLEKVEYRPYLHKFLRIDPMFDKLRDEDRFKRKLAEGEEQVRRTRKKIESMQVEGKLLLNVED